MHKESIGLMSVRLYRWLLMPFYLYYRSFRSSSQIDNMEYFKLILKRQNPMFNQMHDLLYVRWWWARGLRFISGSATSTHVQPALRALINHGHLRSYMIHMDVHLSLARQVEIYPNTRSSLSFRSTMMSLYIFSFPLFMRCVAQKKNLVLTINTLGMSFESPRLILFS